MRPSDTTVAAHRAQLEIYRRMGADSRLALGLQMSDELQRVAADGIRLRHPEYDSELLWAALLQQRLGIDTFRIVYPDRPIVAP